MDEIVLKARAKINLGLDVTGRRDDGYHEVSMIMQSIGIYDKLVFRVQESGIVIETNAGFLPVNENNLIYKAANMLMTEFNVNSGLYVYLNKFIPVAAGLAGGSSDAAATMLAVNRLFNLKLSIKQLMDRAVKIGADVPFCIMRGTVLAEGIGEELTKLAPMPKCPIVIAKPPVNVSTKVVYEKLDSCEIIKHPNIAAIREGIEKGDLKMVADNMGNVLEDVTLPMVPVIKEIKQLMLDNGAINSMMSGSGPTVFGLFEDYDSAKACVSVIKESGLARQVYVTEVFNA